MKNIKVELNTPAGNPYLTVYADEKLLRMQLPNTQYSLVLDRRIIPELMNALTVIQNQTK